jgi:cation diffusion facilitator CzcD-associated flavoprotein CzcO
MTRKKYDAIVVGAGHNGLTAAAYLARARLSTLGLERRAIVANGELRRHRSCRFNRPRQLQGCSPHYPGQLLLEAFARPPW